MREDKDMPNRELKIWLDGKFETVDAKFAAVDDKFKSTNSWMGILFAIALAVIGGISWRADHRIERLEDKIDGIKECPCDRIYRHENK